MLFHVSIEADNPQKVAAVLAELMGGEAMPFPPVAEGSWVAAAGDERATLIEVYPRGTEIHPSEEGAIGVASEQRRHNATHMALGTKLDADRVFAICKREGWTANYFRRGGAFGLIEVFVEGCQMIEVLTPEMQAEYVNVVTIDNWKAMLAAREAAMAEVKQAA
jgi:hypothetical protein